MKAGIAHSRTAASPDDHARAVASFTAAHTTAPHSSLHAGNLGVALMNAGDLDGARRSMQLTSDLLDVEQNALIGGETTPEGAPASGGAPGQQANRKRAKKHRARMDTLRRNAATLAGLWATQRTEKGGAAMVPIEMPASSRDVRYRGRAADVPLHTLAERKSMDHATAGRGSRYVERDITPEVRAAAPPLELAVVSGGGDGIGGVGVGGGGGGDGDSGSGGDDHGGDGGVGAGSGGAAPTPADFYAFMSGKTFADSYWEQWPLLLRPAGVQDDTSPSLQSILDDGPYGYRSKKMIPPHKNVRYLKGSFTDVDEQTLDDTPQRRTGMERSLRRGQTLQFLGVHLWMPWVGNLAHRLGLAVSRPVSVNMYVTPPGRSTSLRAHSDFQCALMIQLNGRKRWRLWKKPDMWLPVRYVQLCVCVCVCVCVRCVCVCGGGGEA
jgi:hypothetical protein